MLTVSSSPFDPKPPYRFGSVAEYLDGALPLTALATTVTGINDGSLLKRHLENNGITIDESPE